MNHDKMAAMAEKERESLLEKYTNEEKKKEWISKIVKKRANRSNN